MREKIIRISSYKQQVINKRYWIFGYEQRWTVEEEMRIYHDPPIRYKCSICGDIVSGIYGHIIHELKKGGLLDKNYPLVCCMCWNEIHELKKGG